MSRIVLFMVPSNSISWVGQMGKIANLRKDVLYRIDKTSNTLQDKMNCMLSTLKSPDVLKEEDWIRIMIAFPVFAMTTVMTALNEDATNRNSITET